MAPNDEAESGGGGGDWIGCVVRHLLWSLRAGARTLATHERGKRGRIKKEGQEDDGAPKGACLSA